MSIVKQRKATGKSLVILTGDIGGTNTRLQLTQFSDDNFDILAIEKYKNADFNDFKDIIVSFLAKHTNIILQRACFAFAGPIVEGKVKLTNLPWYVTKEALVCLLKTSHVYFINDFEAVGYSTLLLKDEDYYELQPGRKCQNGMKAIIGAGTGLGVALLNKVNEYHHVMATEGGHVNFAPSDQLQQELLAHLQRKLHRVSNERIVSGVGITNIYKYIRTRPENQDLESPKLNQLSMFSNNFAKDITEFALKHRDPIALQTLDIFIRCYGSITGNLALTVLPYGGLYIAGGIAPKLLSVMRDGRFVSAFLDKGRVSALISDIPIYIILNTQIALMGAAYYAVYAAKEKV